MDMKDYMQNAYEYSKLHTVINYFLNVEKGKQKTVN